MFSINKKCKYCEGDLNRKDAKTCGGSECIRKRMNDYNSQNKEHQAKLGMERYERIKDTEDYKRKRKEYYQNNREEILVKKRFYNNFVRDKEKHNTQNRKYYWKNPKKFSEINKKSCLKHSDKRKRQRKNYYSKNREKCMEATKKWTKKNIEYWRDYTKKHYDKIRDRKNLEREKLGLPKIGVGNRRENECFIEISNIFSDVEIERNNRRAVGYRLELDIYIPSLNLAFEYNGKQHYNEEVYKIISRTKGNFENQLYRDRLKKRICKIKGIKLIIIRYDENISKDLILNKLRRVNFKI